MNQFIEQHFWKTVGAAAVLSVVCLGLMTWLQEHDARILAEQTVKTSQARIAELDKGMAAVTEAGNARLAALKKTAAEVKTPVQAIAAIPSVSDAPMNPRPVPDLPTAVTVEAIPLYQNLVSCREQSVTAGVCAAQVKTDDAVIAEKDKEIKALSNKGGFWHRLKTNAETIGIGVAIGYGLNAATRH